MYPGPLRFAPLKAALAGPALAVAIGWAAAGFGAAHAQGAGGPAACAQMPPADATFAQAQAHFAALEPQCLRSAAYYRLHGQWLLKQGHHGAAVEALERALLLDAEHLGTQLDYAQALIMVGDAHSASAILSALQALPHVPPHLMPLLAAQSQALQQVMAPAAAPPGLVSKVVLSQSVGGDTNLNNASTAANITLTYPTLDLDLPLAEANRPQSGGMTSTALQWTGLLAHGRQMWLFQAQGRVRHTRNAASRYQQADLAATWLQDPAAPRQWTAQIEHAQLRWADKKLYASEKAGLQHQWAHRTDATTCRTAVGAEVENRTFPGSRSMDGLYRGAVFTLACHQRDSVSLQLRTGLDQPYDAARVGGTQRQTEARVQWQFGAAGYQWQTEYALQHQQDSSGYSPLLSRNATRRVVRHALRLEASHPLPWPAAGNPQWFGNIELSHQASNLQIFASSRKAVQTGLRWAWP